MIEWLNFFVFFHMNYDKTKTKLSNRVTVVTTQTQLTQHVLFQTTLHWLLLTNYLTENYGTYSYMLLHKLRPQFSILIF